MAGNQKQTKNLTSLYKNFLSYVNSEDILNPSIPNILGVGSLNVLINIRKNGSNFVSEVEKRKGYKKVDIKINDSLEVKEFGYNNLTGEFRWDTKSNKSIYVRHYGKNMIVSDNLTEWSQITDTDNSVSENDWNYTSWWDDSAKGRVLLFVNGEENNVVYKWNGLISRVASLSGNTITTPDDTFPDTNTAGYVWINGKKLKYTKILKRVITLESPFLNGGINAIICSDVEKGTLTNHKIFKPVNFKPNIITTFKNHILYADKNQNLVFVSKAIGGKDYLDLNFSVPVLRTDGYTIVTDNLVVAMYNVKDGVLISCKNNEWHYITNKTYNYLVPSEINAYGTDIYHTWIEQKLVSGENQGIKSQWLGRINQGNLYFVSDEPALNFVDWGAEVLNNSQNSYDSGNMSESSGYNKLGRQNLTNLSNEIKKDFYYIEKMGYWEKARIMFYKNEMYINIPKMGRTYIYNTLFGMWQPPQTLPFGAYTSKEGELYAYDSSNSNVYKVFDGYNDNGKEYGSMLCTFYSDLDLPFSIKKEDKFFIKAKATQGAELNVRLNYGYGENGASEKLFFSANPQTIDGIEESAQSVPSTYKNEFVYDIHTDQMENDYMSLINGYMNIESKGNSFKIRQIQISDSKIDTGWKIIAFGTNATTSNESDTSGQLIGENVGDVVSTSDYFDPTEC